MIDTIGVGDAVPGGTVFPWYGKLALYVLLTLIISMSSCTMVTSFDDADEAKYHAEETKAETDADIAKDAAELEMEKARLASMQQLVEEHDFGPVSARCAVEGWDNQGEREICERANALHEASKQ